MENSSEQNQLVEKLKQAGRDELIWLAGYFSGQAKVNQSLSKIFGKVADLPDISDFETIAQIVDQDTLTKAVDGKFTGELGQQTEAAPSGQQVKEITLMYGSHSGNGKSFANTAKQLAEARDYKVKVADMNSYNTRELKKEKNLLVIISTHGEGDPPTQAEEVYDYIHGKKAPDLHGVNFSVLALGDKSYVNFCQTGKEFDGQLEKLGATRIYDRVDCDVDFEEDADKWLAGALDILDEQYGNTIPASQPSADVKTAPREETGKKYSQKNPFTSEVLTKTKLNGRGSQKETYHVELSIAGSGIKYQAGDACGILGDNSDRIVEEFLEVSGLSGIENVYLPTGGVLLQSALKNHFELTVLTADVMRKHSEYTQSGELKNLLEDPQILKDYVYGRDVVDLFKEFPIRYTPQQIIELLRPIPARLYSIASTQEVYEDEVHLLVSALRYEAYGRYKEGSASTFVADRMQEEQKVPLYIKSNEGFRLPQDGNTPIIMVGPGTGVAPFRAFIDERDARGAAGKSWLFFGNPHFTTDFLYQTEFQKHLKKGSLTKMDVAFSRDQEHKIYVQHKIEQNSKELFQWLEDGAVIYVCGDMHYMAPDVLKAFTKVVQVEKGVNEEEATEYIKNLKRNYRYLEDVY